MNSVDEDVSDGVLCLNNDMAGCVFFVRCFCQNMLLCFIVIVVFHCLSSSPPPSSSSLLSSLL